ncbi:LOW QUALITY PROTEIN: hypothetical protein MAR_021409, partial [Mya arenaria]
MASPSHLKKCVPIRAVTTLFLLIKPAFITVERTMFPLVLAYAITSHKSQGGTYEHVIANLEKPSQVTSVCQAMCTQYSAESHLDKDKIKGINEALLEMNNLQDSFDWEHRFPNETGAIAYLNIRSLKAHHTDLDNDPNVQMLQLRTGKVIIAGDFRNIDPDDSRLRPLTTEFNMCQVILQPTHIHGRTLDHLY